MRMCGHNTLLITGNGNTWAKGTNAFVSSACSPERLPIYISTSRIRKFLPHYSLTGTEYYHFKNLCKFESKKFSCHLICMYFIPEGVKQLLGDSLIFSGNCFLLFAIFSIVIFPLTGLLSHVFQGYFSSAQWFTLNLYVMIITISSLFFVCLIYLIYLYFVLERRENTSRGEGQCYFCNKEIIIINYVFK